MKLPTASQLDRAKMQDKCWFWCGPMASNGYGRVTLGGSRRAYAHRESWILAHGTIPDDLFVLHRCDNPPCINPEHLFLGTQAENCADRDQKGRLVVGRRHRGSRNVMSKLNEALVLSIRQRYAAGGETQRALAQDVGVSQATLNYVLLRKSWRHV